MAFYTSIASHDYSMMTANAALISIKNRSKLFIILPGPLFRITSAAFSCSGSGSVFSHCSRSRLKQRSSSD